MAHAIQPATEHKYEQAVDDFLAWADRDHGGARVVWRTYEEVDEDLAAYTEALYEANPRRGERQRAANARAGVIFYAGVPGGSRALPLATKCGVAWDNLVPGKSPPPLTREMGMLVAQRIYWDGRRSIACLVVVLVESYIRLNEGLDLTTADIALPGDLRMGALRNQAGVRVGIGKTGKDQFVPVASELGIAALRWLKENAPAGGNVCDVKDSAVRRVFRSALAALKVQEVGFTIHSLRHGGATHALNSGVPLDEIMVRGRWGTIKSLRRYLQTGQAMLLQTTLPADFVRRVGFLSLTPLVILGL